MPKKLKSEHGGRVMDRAIGGASNDPNVRVKGHNQTVHEMTTQQDEVAAYKFTKEQADTVARKLGWQNADEPFLNGDKHKELQEAGGLYGKIARHIGKWLTDPDSETTIPLTVAEHKELSKLAEETLEKV